MTEKYVFDLFLFTAFGLFLLGAAGALRDPESAISVKMMLVSVLLDLCVRLGYVCGFFKMGFGQASAHMVVTVSVGGLLVWTGCLAVLYLRRRKAVPVFYGLVVFLEIFWFAQLVLYIYRKYGVTFS